MSKFGLVDSGAGCCVLCRGPVFGKAVVYGGFDFVCMNCVEELKQFFKSEEGEVCTVCGRTFKNKGALLAHRKRCKGGEK